MFGGGRRLPGRSRDPSWLPPASPE